MTYTLRRAIHHWRGFRPGALLLLLWAANGCATYSAKVADLRPELAAGEYDAALATIEDKTGDKDRLLYWLERGIVLHYADRWAESNESFAAAERTSEELYSKSVSEGAFSLITNDNSISYRARPYELAMVPYYKALNYAYLEDREAAQVEARRASIQMAQYVDTTLEGIRGEDRGDLQRIRNNAFLLYTSGMLYDWDGEVNDAFIAYRNAAVAYQQSQDLLWVEPPRTLGRDLLRTGRRLGFLAELEQLQRTCPDVFGGPNLDADTLRVLADQEDIRWQQGHGEVVLFLESGWVSKKNQIRFDIPIFEGEAYDDSEYWSWEIYAGMGNMQAMTAGRKVEYWVTVAAPEMVDTPGILGLATVRATPADSATAAAAAGNYEAGSHRVENLSRHARITFDAEKPTIFFKTILRGLTKYLASRGAEKAAGSWGKWAATIFGAVSESADTRSWLTLPGDVHMVRMSLPDGTWDLELVLQSRHGHNLANRTIQGVEVRAGDWTFLSRRIF